MSKSSETQSDFSRCSIKQPFCSDAWFYFSRKIDAANMLRKDLRSSSIRQRVMSGFKNDSVHLKLNSTFYWFETHEHYNILRSIFGHFVMVGYRKRHPKLRDKPRSLLENDMLHVISGSDLPEDPFDKRTVNCGIDFLFTGYELSIYIRYQKFIYSKGVQRDEYPCDFLYSISRFGSDDSIQDAPSSDPMDVEEENIPPGGDPPASIRIYPGMDFDDPAQGIVVKVTNIDISGRVLGTVLAPNSKKGNNVTYEDLNYVRAWIME
jgi:hypothetical protein